jgi:putative ABC transport system ATP-binding protein
LIVRESYPAQTFSGRIFNFMVKAAIQAHQLTRTLPLAGEHIRILKGLSFEIASGEWVALMGPSGSGKSTLLGILAGIDTPSGGSLLLDGEDITSLNEGKLAQIRNRKIGIIFQSFNLIPTLTAQENVEVPLYITSKAPQAAKLAREMLELVGLSDRLRHRPHQLSGGQQQRVAIARALVTQPRFLMADEPTGNLDSTTGQQVLELFATLRRQLGLTLVVATHDGAIAGRADRILRLVDGHLVQAEQPVVKVS